MNKKVKKVVKDFKDFAFTDALLATAVGIMLGSALKDLVSSLIDNILMPPIAYITSGIDFSQLFITIGLEKFDTLEQAQEAGALVITYGQFINSILSFLILAVVLFLLIRIAQNSFKKKEVKKKKTTKKCPYCFSEIDKRATRCPECTSEL
ncbi:MAG: large conductance mechanosensitive channel protein MscL [Candidatus Dojkabacteria bacterium]|nr:large conductance mechanosensitive channel protein MscL [Candidatus Dojkabacteria bacterium]